VCWAYLLIKIIEVEKWGEEERGNKFEIHHLILLGEMSSKKRGDF